MTLMLTAQEKLERIVKEHANNYKRSYHEHEEEATILLIASLYDELIRIEDHARNRIESKIGKRQRKPKASGVGNGSATDPLVSVHTDADTNIMETP